MIANFSNNKDFSVCYLSAISRHWTNKLHYWEVLNKNLLVVYNNKNEAVIEKLIYVNAKILYLRMY